MTLVTWREEFRTGIREIDEEHRELISLINALHESRLAERLDERTEAFLGEIHARIAAHFALEEKIMRTGGYPALAEHKADHERLLDEIRDIMDAHAAQGVLDEEAFGNRLSQWFSVHFQRHDARLHGWQQARQRTP